MNFSSFAIFSHVAGGTCSFTPQEPKEELCEEQVLTLSGTNHKTETNSNVVHYSVPSMWGLLFFFKKEKKPKPKQKTQIKTKKGLEELQREKWDYTCTPESWHELQQ